VTTFRAVYIDGAGAIADRALAYDVMAAIRTFKGQHIDLTIERHQDRRSARQNAYLWGHVYAVMAAHTGHSAEELHEAMVAQFLPSVPKQIAFVNDLTGEALDIDIETRRSSKLTGSRFTDFVDQVRDFAATFLHVATEDPDPDYWKRPRASEPDPGGSVH